jgi:hypothetical protein
VANGLNPEIFIRKMEGNMENAVVAKQRSVAFVMVNGMERKIVPRTRRQINFSKRLNRQDGNVVIVAEPWSS